MFTIRTLLLFLVIGAALRSQGQNVTAAEYFFDKDPGAGKGKALTIGTAGASLHVDDSISTATLLPGLHSLSIRTKTADGKWGLFDTRSFYLSQSSSQGLLSITAAEYFFDKDPGVGKGSSLTISKSSDSIHVVDSIVTTSLQPGPHSLSIRTRTSDDKWSLFDTRSFFLSQTGNKGLLSITAAEYFFDADPGIGKGKSFTIKTPADSVRVVDSAVTISLQPGSHTLSIRTKTSDGKWGLFDTRSFYLTQSSSNGLLNITAAEYFIDKDPGIGKATPLAVTAPKDSVRVQDSIAATSLASGTHTLSIRAKTSDGKWSMFDSRSFYISDNGSGLFNITAAEYFFDQDPGVGKGKSIKIGVASDSIHIDDSVATTTMPFRGNQHWFAVRVKRSDGKWGLYDAASITFPPTDKDRDGLVDYDEPYFGTNYTIFDTNGDYLADGVNVFTGLKPTSTDTDGDGLSNATELLLGTNPLVKDTDGDGVSDKYDPFPLDRFRKALPAPNLSDHTKPVITLIQPF